MHVPFPDARATWSAFTFPGSNRRAAAASVAGFETPESVKYDPDLDVWYVANINGSPVARDDNGYISRLHGDGSVDAMKWIAGGANGVTLNAPKGMALQADTLWVVDVDAVRGFNRRTGAPVASVTLEGAQFLNDAARKQFIIVPFFGNVIRAWTPGSDATIPLATTRGQLDGMEILDAERLLVTSWTDSSLNVLENGKLTPVAGDLPSPADIGLDIKRGRVAIPLLMENRIEFRTLPTAERVTP